MTLTIVLALLGIAVIMTLIGVAWTKWGADSRDTINSTEWDHRREWEERYWHRA